MYGVKSIFKSVQLITLPYFPFEAGTKLETRILEYVSNSIMKIDKSIRRKISEPIASKSINFYKSNTLIGIDISSLSDREVTYLETLNNIIYLYPFILLNSSIQPKRLKSLRLHKTLKDKGYILPCLPRLNPADNLYTAERYGQDLLELIKGTIPELEIPKLENLGINYSIDDLRSRFPYFHIYNNTLRYKFNPCWLGVEDENISRLLDDLFNQNMDGFDFSNKCEEYGLAEEEFGRYAQRSMLFDLADREHIGFRFVRKNIVLSVKASLLQEFENKIYERSVIDTSNTDYKDFNGSFIEYHDLGKLFDINDTFSIKLITDIKEQFSTVEFDKVILIDNGYEENLRILISEIFSKPVSRIINNLGEPQLYPFDNYDFNEKVLIIGDICNRGKLLRAVIDFMENYFKSKVVGVFSFIISTSTNVLNLRAGRPEYDSFLFKYYVEKPLHDVSKISKSRQMRRRQKASTERYLFFWDSINRLGLVKKGLHSSGARSGEFFGDIKEIVSLYLQKIELDENADKAITPHADLSFFVNDLKEKHNFTGCILNDTNSARAFSRILRRIDSHIEVEIVNFQRPSENCRKFYQNQSSLLIYDDGLNAGQEILKFIRFLGNDEDIRYKNCISVFTLFSRSNAVKKNEYMTIKFREKLNELLNDRCYIYYASDLPFYLLSELDDEDKRFRLKVEGVG